MDTTVAQIEKYKKALRNNPDNRAELLWKLTLMKLFPHWVFRKLFEYMKELEKYDKN